MDPLAGKQPFLALTLQTHRTLGAVLAAHVVKLVNRDGGIFTVQENVFQSNRRAWASLCPPELDPVIALIEETTDTHLLKTIGRKHKLLAAFMHEVEKNPAIGQYVRDYVERRLGKIFGILAELPTGVPIFLKAKNFKNLYHEHRLALHPGVAQPIFRFALSPTELSYTLSASLGGETIRLMSRDWQVICNTPCIVRLGNRIIRFEGIDAKKLTPFFTNPRVLIPRTARQKYFETFVLSAIRNHPVEAEGFNILDFTPKRRAVLTLEERLSGRLGLTLGFVYGDKRFLAHTKPQREVTMSQREGSYLFLRFERDTGWEQEVQAQCAGLGLVNVQGAEYLPREHAPYHEPSHAKDYLLIEWLSQRSEAIGQLGIDIAQQAHKAQYYLKPPRLDLSIAPGNDWFDVRGHVVLEGFTIPFMALRRNILHGIREYVLPDGQVVILPHEWFAKLQSIFHTAKEIDGTLRVGRYHFPWLEGIGLECPDVRAIRQRFAEVSTVERVPVHGELRATLRPYQKQGLFWLQLLLDNGLGGCLADDMGLGKTVQTIAILLHALRNGQPEGEWPQQEGVAHLRSTALIVVPTSLIFNWQREVEQFAPSLSVLVHVGPGRQREANLFRKHSIVLTTYGTMRNDAEFLKDLRFRYLVLDESHALKNPLSKGYRAAMLLKAANTLTLSGTPIENSLTDLWSQLNIVNRGMLGTLKSFTREYIHPIEREGDERKAAELKRLIQPFILRRTKEQAARDLPPLTEQVVYCDLPDDQRRLYEAEKSAVRNAILESIGSMGYQRSAISILRGLTRLRQLANHPAMLDPNSEIASGKFEQVISTIESIASEGHKILIFSSFVKHLRIVEQHLQAISLGYTMLTGESRHRGELVQAFQHNPNIKIFLISIKAGGVGLNLTAADYILVLDPWWNPAVESQAIARAHRIGQQKNVFVLRYIAVGTVEEKILRLQERKKLLASEFVGQNNPLSLISEEQMLEILS